MVIVGIWLIVCVIGNINVNNRFPKPIDEYYYLGDTVEYLGMQIKAEEILYKNDDGKMCIRDRKYRMQLDTGNALFRKIS